VLNHEHIQITTAGAEAFHKHYHKTMCKKISSFGLEHWDKKRLA